MKKILNTYFFGYAAYKYRRLIRTPLIIYFLAILFSAINSIDYLPFGNSSLIERVYNEYPLLVSSSGDYYTEKEAKLLFSNSYNTYIEEGKLSKVFVSKDEFIDLLRECDDDDFGKINPLNALLISINKDNFLNQDEYYDEYDNKIKWVNISESELRTKLGISPFLEENYTFKELILLLLFSLFIFGLISFLIEPFIVKKKPLEITKVESTKKTIVHNLNSKIITNKLISYFKYNGSYISGNRYYIRKILQWPLILLFIGFYLRAVTTYYRSRSLKISVFNSYLFGIYSVIIDFYIILIIPFNEKLFGVVPEMQWVFIFPTLPFAYLIFMDGKNNNSNVVEEKIINTEEISKELIETNFNISIQKKENNLNYPFFLKLNEFLNNNSNPPILLTIYRIVLRVIVFFIVYFILFIIPFNLNANWLIPFTILIAFFVTKPISNCIITNWLPALKAK